MNSKTQTTMEGCIESKKLIDFFSSCLGQKLKIENSHKIIDLKPLKFKP